MVLQTVFCFDNSELFQLVCAYVLSRRVNLYAQWE